MADVIHRVRNPDGSIARITAPADADPAAIERFAEQQFYSPAGRPRPAAGRFSDALKDTVETRIPNALAGAGKFPSDLYQGIQQRLGNVTPEQVAETRKLDAPLMATPEGKAGYVGGAIGTTLPLTFIPGANSLTGAAITGGGLGFISPTAPGESVVDNTVKGAAWAAAAQAGGRMLLGPAAPTETLPKQDLIDAARNKYGIQLPVSARTGSKPLGYLESQVATMPGGGLTAGALENANNQYSSAVMGAIGGPGERATQAGFNRAKDATQATYRDIWANNSVQVDNAALQGFSDAIAKAHRTLTPEKARIVERQVDNILAKVDGQGNIAGDVYQMGLRPELRAAAGDGGSLKSPLIDVRKALDAAANRSLTGEDAARLATANRQYASQKALETAIPGAEARGGVFTPNEVLARTRGFGGDVEELGKIGAGLLREPPNSGTATRQLMGLALLGGPGAIYGAANGSYGDAALYAGLGLLSPFVTSIGLGTRPGQNYLTGGVPGIMGAQTPPMLLGPILDAARGAGYAMPGILNSQQ